LKVSRQGTVAKRLVARGSKSEREAVVLQTGEGEYVLRREGGNPFHDPELERLVGKKIRALGREYENNLIMASWEEL
jgi:hypothetical protein